MSDERTRMPRSDVLFVAMCAGTIAFVVGFVLPFFTPIAVPWYYPLERRWAFEVKPHGMAMDFYGRVMLGVAGGSLAVIVSTLITKRLERLDDRVRTLLLAWAATAVVFAMAYFAWSLAYRVPTPEPIPEAYQPR
jgi:MFS family permease